MIMANIAFDPSSVLVGSLLASRGTAGQHSPVVKKGGKERQADDGTDMMNRQARLTQRLNQDEKGNL